MARPIHVTARWCAALLLALTATGCGILGTFEYRSVQSEFDNAVRLDNVASVDPFAEAGSEAAYQSVAEELTPERIAALEPRLQGNAWMLRSVSQWRSGQLTAAVASAEKGLSSGAIQAQSRDQVLLTLLPALAIDSQIEKRWKAENETASVAAYEGPDGYQANFETAFDHLDDTKQSMGPPTPASVVNYYHYQRWRILQNWRQVIASLEDSGVRTRARDHVRSLLGGKLGDLAKEERRAIPDGTDLARLIDAQS